MSVFSVHSASSSTHPHRFLQLWINLFAHKSYIKIQRYWGHQNDSKCRPHHSGDICTTRENKGKQLKTGFSYMGQNVTGNLIFFFLLFEGPWGPSMIRLCLSCFPANPPPPPPYLCTCEIRKQSDKNFLSSNPKYEKNIIYLRGPGWPINYQTGPILLSSHIYQATYKIWKQSIQVIAFTKKYLQTRQTWTRNDD